MNAAGIGATFRLATPGGSATTAVGIQNPWDMSAPQPTTDIVQSLLLDGERPFGYRASNRTMTLPVIIRAPDYLTLTAAQELLIQAIDAQTWTLAWTPQSTGLTQVFDCFRALPTVYSYGFQPGLITPMAVMTLSFQALPYARSDPTGLQNVAFASPLWQGVEAPPTAVVLDNFSAVSGTYWSQSAQQTVTSQYSARYTPPTGQVYPWLPASYAKSFSSTDIIGLTTLSVWLGQSFDTGNWAPWASFISNVTLRWTLGDALGNELTFSTTYQKAPWSNNALAPSWTRISAPIPQQGSTWNSATAYQTGNIANYQGNSYIAIAPGTNEEPDISPLYWNVSFLYSSVTSYKVKLTNWAGGGTTSWVRMNAWLNDVAVNPPSLATPASLRGTTYNIMGTAGTARTPFSAQFQLPQAAPVVQVLTGTGVWWPPVGVTSVKAECVGAGGSGGARTTSGEGGGGGGGEYAAEPALTVAAGTPVPFTCGTGGQSGATEASVIFIQPGTGSWTCPAGVTEIYAECWGSGAAGAFGSGGGGGGEYAAEPALPVTPGNRYQFTIGAGGSNVLWDVAHGYYTTFTGDPIRVDSSGTSTTIQSTTVGDTNAVSTDLLKAISGTGIPVGAYITAVSVGVGYTISAGALATGTPALTIRALVLAHNGAGATAGGSNGGAGGGQLYQPSVNTIHYDGGNGGTAPSYGGGGGGGSGSGSGAGATGYPGSGLTGGPGAVAVSGGGAGGAGASSPGWPTAGSAPGGGGGGGYALTSTTSTSSGNNPNQPGANGAPGQIKLSYAVASGYPVNGSPTTFGSAGTTGTVVTANGGTSVALNTATGAAGGTGSSNTTHYNGGSGFTGSTSGGGGGGSGGSASAGNTSTSSAGAVAVAGGGKGGTGATVNTAPNGLSGSLPGGGGGGSYTEGTGGTGGGGAVTVTYNPPLAPFSTLIASRPGQNAPPSLNPCVPLPNTADLPTGIEYPVPTLVPGQNALFSGTYTVVACAYNWDSPANSRQVIVTVNQYEYQGGPSYQTTVTRTFTPSTDIVNGIVMMGEMTLPVKDIDPSNTSAYFTVSITDTDQADQFLDILFLDTQGQTVIINVPFGGTYENYWIDEPTSNRDLGYILGSSYDRSQSISVLDSSIVSGGPFYLIPGDNLFFCYSPSGTPSVGVSYLARWFLSRLV